jgi:hypothetical protein
MKEMNCFIGCGNLSFELYFVIFLLKRVTDLTKFSFDWSHSHAMKLSSFINTFYVVIL